MNPPCILTIAGSDSGGGAGIQADLKTIMMQGCYGLSVIAALTAQNTRTVAGIHAPDPEFAALQLSVVLEDFPMAAAKTGMLFSAGIIEAVADGLAGKTFPLVVDPVCVSQSGVDLLQPEAVEALKARLLPLADLLTPNIPEAELLSGVSIGSESDAAEAIRRLLDMGAKAVLLKGGHAEAAGEDVTDYLQASGGELRELRMPRVATKHTHGTGCTLSAAIASHLGLGEGLEAAVRAAQGYLNMCLRRGYALGGGEGPPNHLAPWLEMRGGNR